METAEWTVCIIGLVGIFLAGANWEREGGFIHIIAAIACSSAAVVQLSKYLLG